MRVLKFLLEWIIGIDPLFTWAGLGVVVIALVWFVVKPAAGSVWFLTRPLAVLFGHVPRTAYDFLVIGWKAERRRDWTAALSAYHRAIELDPKDTHAQERRDALIAAHPELATVDKPAAVTPPSTPTASSARPWHGR